MNDIEADVEAKKNWGPDTQAFARPDRRLIPGKSGFIYKIIGKDDNHPVIILGASDISWEDAFSKVTAPKVA